MPAKDRNQQFKLKTAVCPYYKSSTPQLIRCGDIPEVSLIQIAFDDRSSRKSHERLYCCGRYRLCPFWGLHKN